MIKVSQSDDPNNITSVKELEVLRVEVKEAYFAKRIDTPQYEGTTREYTVVSGDTLSKIAKKNSTTVTQIKNNNGLNNDLIIPGQKLQLEKRKKIGDKVSFKKIDAGFMGLEAYVLVETKNAEGVEMHINIKQGKEKGIVEVDEVITVEQDGTDVAVVKCEVGSYCNEDGITNGDDFADFAIARITLRPKDENKQKVWIDGLEKLKDQKTNLYLLVDAHSNSERYITYYGRNPYDEGKPDYKTCPNQWLDMDSEWFELVSKNCYCKREMTVKEIKFLINKSSLFSHPKCPLPNNSKTYAKFTEQINSTFRNYNIDTCLKKAHFLAQIEAESDHFNTTVEYADGSAYEGRNDLGNTSIGDGKLFKGRGLIQLTGRSNYTKYFKYLQEENLITTPEIIGNNLKYTFDSAGWYWIKGSAWGDMNKRADEDDLIAVSIGVNGGLNGYAHRKKNLKSIIKLMKIDKNCVSLIKSEIGVYKYETSAIKNSKYGKKAKNKANIKKFDD